MFTRFSTQFANIETAAPVAGASLHLSADTRLETRQGWRRASQVLRGDEIATLDGGFVRIGWASRPKAAEEVFVIPASALGNCSELVLPLDAEIAIEAPMEFQSSSDHVILPLAAFEGQHGIHRETRPSLEVTLGFETEEVVWAQTGLLLYARPMTSPFFHSLSFAEARAMLALIDAAYFPDAVAA